MSEVGPIPLDNPRMAAEVAGGGAVDVGAADATSSRWVACAAGLCAVHCLASPLLALVAPFLVISEQGEWWVWGGTVVAAIALLAVGPIPRSLGVTVPVVLGAVVWAASLLGWFEPLPEFVTSPVGSVLIAGGMLWSARLCRSGACRAGEATSPR